MQIIPHLVRRHEDILDIPSARYIFIFVDFNERNVILEKPDQDLGDKKVVTVKAAQKLGGMYLLYNYCQSCSKARQYVFVIQLLSKLLKS